MPSSLLLLLSQAATIAAYQLRVCCCLTEYGGSNRLRPTGSNHSQWGGKQGDRVSRVSDSKEKWPTRRNAPLTCLGVAGRSCTPIFSCL